MEIETDNFVHDIPKEENDNRVWYINTFDGKCPVCRERIVESIYGGFVIDKPSTEKIIYLCNKCGIVARQEIEFLSEKLREIQRRINTFDLIVNILNHKENNNTEKR